MLFGMPYRHALVGFMLVMLNLLILLNNAFIFIDRHIVFTLLVINVLALIYLLRLAAQSDAREGFIIFASLFIICDLIGLLIYPLEFHPNDENYAYRQQDIVLLWGFFVGFIALIIVMIRSVRHTRSVKADKHYFQELYRGILNALPIPIALYKRGQEGALITNKNGKDLSVVERFTSTRPHIEAIPSKDNPISIVRHFVDVLWAKFKHEDKERGTVYFEKRSSIDGIKLFNIGYSVLDLSDAHHLASPDIRQDHLLLFGTEISQHTKLVYELTQAKEAAQQSNQAKSTFLANVSHELRTPITSILGFSQIIRIHEDLPSEIIESVDIITRNGESLLALVNDVLDLSKAEANSLSLQESYVDINTLIYEEIQSLKVQADSKELSVDLHISLSLTQQFKLDEGKVRQIFRNLLSNALKFTDEGDVTIYVWSSKILTWQAPPAAFTRLSATEIAAIKEKTSALPIPEGKTMLHFEVCDTGKGISAKELSSIFEPFIQSRSGLDSKQGTGLGLAISKKYAEFLGGDLQIQSQENEGTRCHVYLPVEAQSPEQARDNEAEIR